MKITDVRTYRVAGQGWGPFLICVVDTDAGIKGFGEVGLSFWHGAAVEQAIHHLSALVVGQDPWSTERLWQQMWRGLFFPPGPIYGCAVSAIDIALWDIKGKAAGLPVYKLLGGPVRDKVACYPHAHGGTTRSLVDSCLQLQGEGWKFLRWHLSETAGAAADATASQSGVLDPRRAVSLAVEQVEAVRHALGPDIEICLDVHTRLDTAHAIELCTQLERLRPYFIEDPLRSEHAGSYATLARHTKVPIAAGEQWAGKWAFRDVVEQETIRYARIDVCIVGGLTEALKVTHWCEAHYIDIAPHNPLGPVSAAACVALCMASTNVGVQEMPRRPGTTALEVAPVQIEWEDGFAWCPDVPGLGVEIDEDACAAAVTSAAGFAPRLERPDGAFTNW